MSRPERDSDADKPNNPGSGIVRALIARLRTHRRELLWVGAGSLLALLGNFAGVKLLTRLLKPDAYGELALGMTAAGVLISLAYSPIASAMLRFYPAPPEVNALAIHVAAFRRIGARLSAAAGLVVLLIAAIVGRLTEPKWGVIVALGAGYSVCNGLAVLQVAWSTSVRKRETVTIYQVIDTWARPLGACAIVLLVARNGTSALAGYLLAGIFNLLVQRWLAARTPAITASRELSAAGEAVSGLTRDALLYALPMSLTALFTSISSYGDRWTLQGLLGPSDLGIYAALCQVGTVPSALVSTIVAAFILPIAFQRAGSLSTRKEVRAAMRMIGWALLACASTAIPVTALLAIAGEPIMSLLTAPGYSAHADQLWIIALAGFLLALGRIALLSVEVLRKTSHQLLPWVINAVITVALSLVFGTRWGMNGIVAALFVSNALCALACFWVAVRLMRSRIEALPE